ncbi:MAG TPA: phage major capsid protein [Anaerolineae bacterium]|nr:phage major capsid protein [Anaerolineae bacterium]HUW11285.1 phage major capsid protein [Anaerolineae bacterium]
MANFDHVISRNDAAALIPEDVSPEIIKGVSEMSTVMKLGRRVPDMPRAQRRMPVLSSLPTAYFVSRSAVGAGGLKRTTELLWGNKYLNAEEIACIIPIPEDVLDDVDYDIWGQIRPPIIEEFGRVFDAAVFWGTNAPAAWPLGLLPLAAAATPAHTVTDGTGADLYDDLMNENGVIAKIEADGYMATGHVAAISLRGRLRGLRDANGNPIFVQDMSARTGYDLDGAPIEFPLNDSWDATQALLITGDWNQLIYCMRQDITYKVLDQAVIQDEAGNITFNLAQQDMVALRCVMRLAWQVPNPIRKIQPTEANRWPFSVLLPAA